MKKTFSVRTIILAGSLLLCACPGAGTAQAAPGTVVAWGYNGNGQTTVPVAAQSGVTAVAAGTYHTVALKNDGSVLAWGHNSYSYLDEESTGTAGDYNFGQTTVPVAAQSGVTAIAAGFGQTVALLGTAPPPPQLTIIRSGANVVLTWPTNAAGFTLQSTTNLLPTAWSPVAQATVTNAGQISATVPTTAGNKFFRLTSL